MAVERGIIYGAYGAGLGADVSVPGGARASMGAAVGTCVIGPAEAGGRGQVGRAVDCYAAAPLLRDLPFPRVR